MLTKNFVYTAATWTVLAFSIANHSEATAQDPGHSGQSHGQAFPVPSSIEAEHKELHEMLAKASKSGGKTAAAAKEVGRLLQPHFVKEEQFALPPLGLLPDVAAGKPTPNAGDIIEMTDRLKTEMPEMLAEHRKIADALQRLRKAARQEHKQEAVQFADLLSEHATQEEQILYPSAILVGEYLKLKPK